MADQDKKWITSPEAEKAYTYLPEDIEIPKMRETEEIPLKDKIAVIKIFNPSGSWTWYVIEADRDKGEMFCYVAGDFKEFGYVSLDEIKAFKGFMGLPLERDIWFKPTKISDLPEYEG